MERACRSTPRPDRRRARCVASSSTPCSTVHVGLAAHPPAPHSAHIPQPKDTATIRVSTAQNVHVCECGVWCGVHSTIERIPRHDLWLGVRVRLRPWHGIRTYAARLASGDAPACSPREHDARCPIPLPPPRGLSALTGGRPVSTASSPFFGAMLHRVRTWYTGGSGRSDDPRLCHTGYELRTGYTGGSGRSCDPRLCHTGYELRTGYTGGSGRSCDPRLCHTGYELRTGYTGGSGRSCDPRLCYTGYELGTPGEAGEAAIPRRRGVCLPRPRLRDIPPRARSHAF